jgi:hypothetical protein
VPKLPYNPAEYSLVAERITEFYERFPSGRIITDLVSRERDIVFRAEVYRRSEDTAPAATGWASERDGDSEINLIACLENSETSAIGRALANLGFTASKKRASYEEMEKAERVRLRFQQVPASTRSASASQRVAEMKRPDDSADHIAEQKRDLLLLMAQAADHGVPADALEELTLKLHTAVASSDELTATERKVRHWILNGYPASRSNDSEISARSSSPVNTPSQ